MRVAKASALGRVVETRVGGKMFTGTVWAETLLPHEKGAGLNRVTFAPGARTWWHRHEGGQMLIGEAGRGLVVTRSGEVTAIGDGIVVQGCPNEEHWHGAMPDAFMTHLSCVLVGQTEFLEEVSEADYLAAVERARAVQEHHG